MPKAITYIDLFSCIGGFREGLSRAGGLTCMSHCEIDKYTGRDSTPSCKNKWKLAGRRPTGGDSRRLT